MRLSGNSAGLVQEGDKPGASVYDHRWYDLDLFLTVAYPLLSFPLIVRLGAVHFQFCCGLGRSRWLSFLRFGFRRGRWQTGMYVSYLYVASHACLVHLDLDLSLFDVILFFGLYSSCSSAGILSLYRQSRHSFALLERRPLLPGATSWMSGARANLLVPVVFWIGYYLSL